MHPIASFPRALRVLAAALPLLAAACSPDAATAPKDAELRLAALQCTVTVADGSTQCTSPSAAPAASASWMIIGGQNRYVRLTGTSGGYDPATTLYIGNVTVTNLLTQPMGTPDGTTVTGVRVFFHTPPVATSGAGTIQILNADGTGSFTGSNQPYYLYNQIIPAGGTSAEKAWIFSVPATVLTFSFQVYVDTRLPDESLPPR